ERQALDLPGDDVRGRACEQHERAGQRDGDLGGEAVGDVAPDGVERLLDAARTGEVGAHQDARPAEVLRHHALEGLRALHHGVEQRPEALRVLPEGLRRLGGHQVALLVDQQVAALRLLVEAGLEHLEVVDHRDRRGDARLPGEEALQVLDELQDLPAPERAERRRAGMSWSAAGRYVKQVTVKQTTPTTAKSPRSQMAVMRFTMSEPKPITVVTAEIVSGSQTRAKARTTISSGGAPAATCS